MMEKNAKIYVAGHRGMVGSAIVRELQRQGYTNIVTRTHKELDLTRQDAVEKFFAAEKPEYVFLAAAKVGGIVANQKSDVLKFLLEDNCSLVVRPSGTEPKLKIYISVSAENKEMAEEVEDEIAKTAEKWIC